MFHRAGASYIDQQTDNGDIRFRMNAAHDDLLMLDGSEMRVGIKTTSPEAELHVAGSAIVNYALAHGGESGQNRLIFTTATQTFQTGGTDRMVIDSNGHINIPSDSTKLRVGADADMAFYHDGSTGYVDNDTGTLRLQAASEVWFDCGGSNIARIKSGEVFSFRDVNINNKVTLDADTGALVAVTKSFDIEHPTKEGKRLHHGVLEGPEHGVYIRGRLEGDVIELPDYWVGLVDEDTITVQLTPNKSFQQLYVHEIKDNTVHIKEMTGRRIDCFYFIQAERKDIDKMVVEY